MLNKHRLSSVAATILLSLGSSWALAQDVPHIWQLASDLDAETLKLNRDNIQPVSVNVDASLMMGFKPGSQFRLPVLAQTLDIELLNEKLIGTTRVWQAKNLNAPQLPAIQLFINNGQLSAWIPTNKGTYRLENGQLIKEFKPHGTPEDHRKSQEGSKPELPSIIGSSDASGHFHEHGGDNNDWELHKADGHSHVHSGASSVSHHHAQAAGDLTYRVLFVVTNEFVSTYPDTAARITEYITANNAIYEASGINVQMESAGMVQADFEQYTPDQLLDNISSVGDTDGQISDDELNPIWQARIDNRADFVVVLMNDLPNGLCGQGWLNGNSSQSFRYNLAVNVTSAFTTFSSGSQFCGFETLGHELGHNMGLGHSFQQGDEGTVFTYGRGYGINNQFTTVMAYPQEFGTAEGVALFSSPDLTCLDSFACGVDRNQSDGADAVYAVNQVKEEISLIHNEAVTLPIADVLSTFNSDFQSCINIAEPNIFTNEQLINIQCSDVTLSNYDGMEKFPNLQFVSVAANNASLTPFENIPNIDVLDFRGSSVSSLREVAHLKDKLRFLQFSATQMSCQDVNVVQSWGVDQLSLLQSASCTNLSSDTQDFDNDGMSNLVDTDDDNDGLDDITDHAPFDASNANDIDNDGVADASDAFPYDENESVDTDSDTVGNNADTDDDNDGVEDAQDCAPLDNTLTTDCSGSGSKSFVSYDYDGDGKADVGVRRASTFFQYILNSGDGEIQRVQFGRNSGDISVSGDFDGDRIADVAVRRSSNQFWYILNSSNGEIQRFNFGLQSEDIPVPADYDGDGTTDIAVRRPSNQFWYILNSSDNEIQRFNFGLQSEDIPVPADYDGDGKADIAVRRPSNQFWYILNSSDSEIQRINFGLQSTDIPVPADFDGDGKADVAVRRASNQFWYIRNSSGVDPIGGNADGISRVRFGLQAGDIPIVADYDGDGRADIAVRRPANEIQYILRSSDGEIERITFGRNTADMPLAAPVSTRVEVTVSAEAGRAAVIDDVENAYTRSIMTSEEIMEEEVK